MALFEPQVQIKPQTYQIFKYSFFVSHSFKRAIFQVKNKQHKHFDISKQMADKATIQALDKLTRNRIFNSRYWKEECFALNAQTIIDKAIRVKTIGGLYGGAKKPTKFLCLVYKMVQMNLSKQMALQYLKAREEKYLTAITLFYLRLTRKGAQLYEILEPFYNDNRKLVLKDSIGRHQILHIDELADKLLNNQVVFGIALPFLQKRTVLEDQEVLEPRVSILEEELPEQKIQEEQSQKQSGEEWSEKQERQ